MASEHATAGWSERGRRTVLALSLCAPGTLSLHRLSGVGLAGEADVLRHGSGIYDVLVMGAVHRESAHGLGADVRDLRGRPISPRTDTAP